MWLAKQCLLLSKSGFYNMFFTNCNQTCSSYSVYVHINVEAIIHTWSVDGRIITCQKCNENIKWVTLGWEVFIFPYPYPWTIILTEFDEHNDKRIESLHTTVKVVFRQIYDPCCQSMCVRIRAVTEKWFHSGVLHIDHLMLRSTDIKQSIPNKIRADYCQIIASPTRPIL